MNKVDGYSVRVCKCSCEVFRSRSPQIYKLVFKCVVLIFKWTSCRTDIEFERVSFKFLALFISYKNDS